MNIVHRLFYWRRNRRIKQRLREIALHPLTQFEIEVLHDFTLAQALTFHQWKACGATAEEFLSRCAWLRSAGIQLDTRSVDQLLVLLPPPERKPHPSERIKRIMEQLGGKSQQKGIPVRYADEND